MGKTKEKESPKRPSALRSRAAALLAGVTLLLLTVVFFVGEKRFVVFKLIFTEGVLAATWVGAGAAGGSWLLQRLLAPDDRPRGVFHFVTAAGLGLGLFSLAILGLGLAGWLNRATVIALPVVAALPKTVAALRGWRSRRASEDAPDALEAWLSVPAGPQWLWLAAMPFLAVALVGDSLLPNLLWKPDDPHPYDVMEYHLQLPREWYEAGRIGPLQHNVFSFFPLNSEMQSLAAMHLRGGPWRGMYLAQFLSGGAMCLAALAVYGAARRRGGNGTEESPMPAVLAGVTFAAVPWISMLAATAYDEGWLLLYATLAVGWALRGMVAAEGRSRLRAMAVGGLFAGLACGVKYTAVPLILLGVPACAFAAQAVAARRDTLRFLRPCALFVLCGLLTFAPWLARNVAWAGNPVFPLATHLLGRAHWTEHQVERFEYAHSPHVDPRPGESLDVRRPLPVAQRWPKVWGEIFGHWQYGFGVWILAGAALIVAVARRRTGGFHLGRPALFLWLLLLLTLAVWVGFTHLIGRFFILGVPVAALLVGSVRWGKLAPWAAVALLTFAFVGWWGWPIGGSVGDFPELTAVGAFNSGPQTTGVVPRLARKTDLARAIDLPDGFFGFTDVGVLLAALSDQLMEAEQHGGDTVALIGEAQPFMHPIPMNRLTYRTVFDVDDSAGFPGAWLPPNDRAARQGRQLAVYTSEVARLARTYLFVPPLPPDMDREMRVQRHDIIFRSQ